MSKAASSRLWMVGPTARRTGTAAGAVGERVASTSGRVSSVVLPRAKTEAPAGGGARPEPREPSSNVVAYRAEHI